MKQLTGLDATFLYMETPTTFGHVNGLMIYERPNDEFDPFQVVYDKFASMVGAVEPMRRRLVEVPFGLDHPHWIDDPSFDLDFHIRQLRVAAPGRIDQLTEQVSRIVGRPMDRTRPLWEVYVIEGLESGHWALLTKYHHATIDGAAGRLMLELISDTDPDAPPPEPSPEWEPDEIPTDAELVRRAVARLAADPLKAVRTQARFMRQFAEAAGVDSIGGIVNAVNRSIGETIGRITGRLPNEGRSGSSALSAKPAPKTPWNRTITAHRRFAVRTSSLENIKALKNTFGGTVNDVVLAICAGGLREYLIRHDALPDEPLRAMVPVSIRTGDESDPWTNRVSGLVAELPTNLADPLQRVARISESMAEAKRNFELIPAEALVDMAQISSPVVATAAVRLASQFRLSDRFNPTANLVISNVPGPREPLYFGGAKMLHQFPVSIVTDGQGLNITVQSYLDRLDFGFIADRELVPDVWDLADLHIAEIANLFEATGAEWAVPPEAPRPRRGPNARTVAPPLEDPAPTPGTPRKRAARTTGAKKTGARKTAAPKRAATKPAAKKSAGRTSPAKKAPAKKAAAKQAPARKATARTSPAE